MDSTCLKGDKIYNKFHKPRTRWRFFAVAWLARICHRLDNNLPFVDCVARFTHWQRDGWTWGRRRALHKFFTHFKLEILSPEERYICMKRTHRHTNGRNGTRSCLCYNNLFFNVPRVCIWQVWMSNEVPSALRHAFNKRPWIARAWCDMTTEYLAAKIFYLFHYTS